MKIPSFLTSSVNQEELGLTVKGVLTALVPVILVFAGLTHVNVGQDQINQLIDATVNVVIAASALVSACMFLIGLTRKFFVAMGWIVPKA